MAEFDIFANGISELDAYLVKMKSDLVTLNEQLVRESLDVAEKIIVNRASIIDFPRERVAFQTQNRKTLTKGGANASGKIVNDSQDATYAEYGTGFIGQNNPYIYGQPYPGQFLGYNAPSEFKKVDKSGITFWFYNGVPTYGMPSYHVMYSSARDLERQIPNIVRKLMKGKFDK